MTGTVNCVLHHDEPCVFCTHIFERQHDGCDDARHKYYNPQHTEQAMALGEVDLERGNGQPHTPFEYT